MAGDLRIDDLAAVDELETLSVLPEERGRGVGSALVDAVEERLRDRGVSGLSVTASVTNVSSNRFYEMRGMEPAFRTFLGRI